MALKAFTNSAYFCKKVHLRTCKLSLWKIAFGLPKILFPTTRCARTPGCEPMAYTNGHIHLFGFACVMNKAVEQTISSQSIS